MRWRLGWITACVILAAACSSADPTSDPTPGTATLTSPVPTAAPAPSIDETSEPANDSGLSTPPSAGPTLDQAAPVLPEGFDRVAAIATSADGEVCELCLWLAETPTQRATGLMFVTDLGGADGMAFRYPQPHTGNFWMKNTVLPLSIAFFDADGTYLDEFDMEPCTTPTCPRYRTPRNFLVAIETVQGALPDIGIGPGSSLDVSDQPCK